MRSHKHGYTHRHEGYDNKGSLQRGIRDEEDSAETEEGASSQLQPQQIPPAGTPP